MPVRHLVVGAGEVGTAVHEVLDMWSPTAVLRDVDPIDLRADTLHICFPWSARFAEQVHGYTAEHGADLVIVHSTVPVGTCDPHGWVHSPVRGRHPNIADALGLFTKHFGGERADEAAKLWSNVSPTAAHALARDTEAGKLWELIQFGINIQVEKAIHAWCIEHGVDPDVAYTQFAQTYNDGYAALRLPEFVRPVLKHMPGPIGGHCVAQNAWMVDHPIARLVDG